MRGVEIHEAERIVRDPRTNERQLRELGSSLVNEVRAWRDWYVGINTTAPLRTKKIKNTDLHNIFQIKLALKFGKEVFRIEIPRKGQNGLGALQSPLWETADLVIDLDEREVLKNKLDATDSDVEQIAEEADEIPCWSQDKILLILRTKNH